MPESDMTQDDLRLLAEQKEQEWRKIQQIRTSSLEVSLKEKQKEQEELTMKFNKLKEDFKYNLKLLNDRHAELDNYDKLVSGLRSAISARDAEISELKIRVDAYKTSTDREAASRDDMARHYQQRLREVQADLDQYRVAKDEDIASEREKLETSRRLMERRILHLEEELQTQKHELNSGFEEAMRTREQDFRAQIDEMNTTVLAHELQVKLLKKELEVAKSAAEKTNAVVSESDSHQRELEKALKKAQWELHDTTAMKDARISELLKKVERSEKDMKHMQEDFGRRYSELDRVLREREACITKLKEAVNQKDSEKASHIRELESQLEEAGLQFKHMEWNLTDITKDKDNTIERLQIELNDTKLKLDQHVNESHKDESAKDIEIDRLRDSEARLKDDLAQRKIDLERYKKELIASVDRESDLQRAKSQLELEWKQRYEDIERQQYEGSESLVKGLTRARDNALTECAVKDTNLKRQEELIKVLKADQEEAFLTLKQHGLTIDRSLKPPSSDTETDPAQVQELRTQNENLLAVIREMRKEMETLGAELPAKVATPTPQAPPTTDTRNYPVANEYVKTLEKEVQTLKSKLRKLQHEAEHKSTAKAESPEKINLGSDGDNPVVKSHIEGLNNTIGALRTEKMELVTQLRKHQTRISYIESELSNLSKEPIQKQAQIEQLQYELSSQQRRHQVEVAGLRARVADLELQLAETRKEADEYYKATIERNLETTALGQELSKMKMELGQKRPAVNFGAQELVIQQLQSEINRLTQLHKPEASYDVHIPESGGPGPKRWAENSALKDLQAKLKQAARHITTLAREKKQLIEMGNRLRAQLYSAGVKSDAPSGASAPHVGPLSYVPPGGVGFSGQARLTSGHLASSSGLIPTTASSSHMMTGESAMSSGSGGVAGLSEKMKNKLIQLERLQYELTKQKLVGEQREPLVSTGELDLSVSSGSVSLGVMSSGGDEDEPTEQDEYRPTSILKKPRDPPVKLSPVPEHAVPVSRPQTSASDVPPPRPTSALSDTFGPGGGRRSAQGAMLSMSSMGMSSLGGQSLAEIWKMLDDEGASPRPFTPLNSTDGPFRGLQYPGDAYDRPSSSHELSVRGSRPQLQPRPQAQPSVSQSVSKKKGKKAGPKTKIRNYNVKDD